MRFPAEKCGGFVNPRSFVEVSHATRCLLTPACLTVRSVLYWAIVDPATEAQKKQLTLTVVSSLLPLS